MRLVKPILLILSSTLACSRAMEMLAVEHADTVEMVLVDGERYEGDLLVLDDTSEPISRAMTSEQMFAVIADTMSDWTPMVLVDTGPSFPPPVRAARVTGRRADQHGSKMHPIRTQQVHSSLGRRERATAGITDARPRRLVSIHLALPPPSLDSPNRSLKETTQRRTPMRPVVETGRDRRATILRTIFHKAKRPRLDHF